MSDWREGFHRDVLAWIPKYLNEMRPHLDWGTPAEIVSIEEELDKSFGGSDVTAGDDPRIMLTISWKNTAGEQHLIYEEMTLTDLMRRLDA
ncbi:hypothetical protein ACFWPK_04425 [Nocardia sp. NPDC058519]|uniref:hypothetical protein n=1 Tax=Nocardia sp. NPDC058519 TaxID=3346535 RepID=UPI003656CFEE